MSESIQGYTFKIKDAEGNWIDIPVLYTNIYDAYVEYCAAQTPAITPVTRDVYYATLGELEELVTQLGTTSTTISEFTQALAAGALPLSLGGLGAVITTAPTIPNANITYTVLTTKPDNWETVYVNYYTRSGSEGSYVYTKLQSGDAHTWATDTYYKRIVTFATLQAYLDTATTYAKTADVTSAINAATSVKINSAAFATGTAEPSNAGLSSDAQYYFQYI